MERRQVVAVGREDSFVEGILKRKRKMLFIPSRKIVINKQEANNNKIKNHNSSSAPSAIFSWEIYSVNR